MPPGIGLETLVLAHALVESTELFYDNIHCIYMYACVENGKQMDGSVSSCLSKID